MHQVLTLTTAVATITADTPEDMAASAEGMGATVAAAVFTNAPRR